jgi:hypothetical protein
MGIILSNPSKEIACAFAKVVATNKTPEIMAILEDQANERV